ncbi:MAG: hypothetical protein EA358_07600 [Flavobacteriales bacterium]|nr:MAG: hypothetical protein EA358_07600 [Flavobacteriales bacterium]
MMIRISMHKLIAFSIFATTLIGLSSCSQDDRPYEITVMVTVQDSIPVRNALVRMFAPVENTIVDEYASTNEFGEARFVFDNKVFLEVHAVKGSWRKCDGVEINRGPQTMMINLYPFRDPRRTCSQQQ